jgi:hypothetical protein
MILSLKNSLMKVPHDFLFLIFGFDPDPSIEKLLAKLRKDIDDKKDNIWNGGRSVSDYWDLRVTCEECYGTVPDMPRWQRNDVVMR